MKKFLALVLALVMTMSLVTIAGAKDFDDNADITYVEAVDVMSDLKIVDGDTAGNFNPTAGLTRGAAAKIICNLVLGPTTAAELNADTDPFVDVDKDSTFAGYIAYCAKEGIVGGYADGSFKPAAPLTGYAFMKMLLGALGYDPALEGYTGANWSINVAKQALSSDAADMDAFQAEAWIENSDLTVAQALSEKIAIIGEKLSIRRFEKIVNNDGCVVSYVHGGGRIGVLIDAKCDVVNEEVTEALKNVAMQVAALKPQYVCREEISAEFIAKEVDQIIWLVQLSPYYLPYLSLNYLDMVGSQKRM